MKQARTIEGHVQTEAIKSPQPSPIQFYLEKLLADYADNRSGAVADYIPELATANPDWFGIAMVTVDGHVYQAGDTREPFTIQSTSKALTYGLALEDNGINKVLNKIGVEPSGDAFNSISLDPDSGRPLNPMINAGAIATTSMIQGPDRESRLQRILDKFALFFGHPVQVNEKVYQSESDSGHRNRAISHMLRNFNIIEEDPTDSLELYFQQCSIEVTCRDLALAAATLANGGINPITGVIALRNEFVENVLSVMTTCGMYDFAGSWIYEIGMPAKSGVGGGILAVLPGQLGIGVFSPRLDPHGNSVRGIEVCRRLAKDFSLHIFNPARVTPSVIRSSYNVESVRSKRLRSIEENNILNESGKSIVIQELHGDLMFGTTEIVITDIMQKLDAIDVLLLDMNRVFSINNAATRLLIQLCKSLAESGKLLFFVNIVGNFTFTKNIKRELRDLQDPGFLHFVNKEEALEWCEHRLIQGAGYENSVDTVPLGRQCLLAGFTDEEVEEVKELIDTVTYQPGELIFNSGDPADCMYFINTGEVNIDLPLKRDLTRVAKLGPGMSFGELAMVQQGGRSAQAMAQVFTVCYVLKRNSVEETLSEKIRYKLLLNISKRLAQSLRSANAEIIALS